MPTPAFAGHSFKIVKYEHVKKCGDPADNHTYADDFKGYTIAFIDDLDNDDHPTGLKGTLEKPGAHGSASFTWQWREDVKPDGTKTHTLVITGAPFGGKEWKVDQYRQYRPDGPWFLEIVWEKGPDESGCTETVTIKMEQI